MKMKNRHLRPLSVGSTQHHVDLFAITYDKTTICESIYNLGCQRANSKYRMADTIIVSIDAEGTKAGSLSPWHPRCSSNPIQYSRVYLADSPFRKNLRKNAVQMIDPGLMADASADFPRA
jgi:hypothetical protein